MAADSNDRLFWVCVTDHFNGVLVQRSDDGGESWTEPLRLNHRDTADSHTPSIAVNKDGVIGLSWYERHDKCLDIYFTASLDSGQTFLPEVQSVPISPVSFQGCSPASREQNGNNKLQAPSKTALHDIGKG
jgi:Neuraminidase (sialidase)